jgi:hypothetical protein
VIGSLAWPMVDVDDQIVGSVGPYMLRIAPE